MLIYDKHIISCLNCNKIKTNTVYLHVIFKMPQLQIWSCFNLYSISKDKGNISEGRYINSENPGNSGNEEAECIIDCE